MEDRVVDVLLAYIIICVCRVSGTEILVFGIVAQANDTHTLKTQTQLRSDFRI